MAIGLISAIATNSTTLMVLDTAHLERSGYDKMTSAKKSLTVSFLILSLLLVGAPAALADHVHDVEQKVTGLNNQDFRFGHPGTVRVL